MIVNVVHESGFRLAVSESPRLCSDEEKVNVWKLDHVVPASDVDVEEQRLAEVLAGAGYDVGMLSLNALAQQVLAERAKAVVTAIGIEPSNWPHFPLGNGGVEVRFQFGREEDQVNAKLALA